MISPNNSRERRTFVCVEPTYRVAVAELNWRAILFWAALWWFIYSAPSEGLLTRAFLEPAHAPVTDLAEGL